RRTGAALMDADVRDLITAFHADPLQAVLALTGGGASVGALLLGVPGGSRTVLDFRVPYGEQALTRRLRPRPRPFCSADTARPAAPPRLGAGPRPPRPRAGGPGPGGGGRRRPAPPPPRPPQPRPPPLPPRPRRRPPHRHPVADPGQGGPRTVG